MIKPILLALLLTAAPFAGARAQDVLPVWTIQPADSRLTFSGTLSEAPVEGSFTDFSGTVTFDPLSPRDGKGTIKIGIDSVTTRDKERDQYLVRDAWFGSNQFPTATYQIESFERNTATQFVAHGRLTIRDVAMPVDLPFTFTSLEDDSGRTVAHIFGRTSLKRLDFNIGQGEWKNTSVVGNDVVVNVDITAIRSQ